MNQMAPNRIKLSNANNSADRTGGGQTGEGGAVGARSASELSCECDNTLVCVSHSQSQKGGLVPPEKNGGNPNMALGHDAMDGALVVASA